jgi:hypothetical protein
MENLQNRLARLGYRAEARDPECWQVAQVGGPARNCRRRKPVRQPTSGGLDLYMWILQTSQVSSDLYRVTRLPD